MWLPQSSSTRRKNSEFIIMNFIITRNTRRRTIISYTFTLLWFSYGQIVSGIHKLQDLSRTFPAG